jgi:hypothetical protein
MLQLSGIVRLHRRCQFRVINGKRLEESRRCKHKDRILDKIRIRMVKAIIRKENGGELCLAKCVGKSI